MTARHAHNRYIGEYRVAELRRPERESIHDRHGEVEQDHGWMMAPCQHQSFSAVARGNDAVTRLSYREFQKRAAIKVVVHDEYGDCV
jgi:hypothetical protein